MTRARVFSQSLANISAASGGTTNVTLATLQPFLTTSNVVQRGSNLYFSNALSFANLQLASINDLFDVVTTTKSNNQALIWNGFEWAPGNVIVTANLALNTTNDLREGSSNLYYTNARARTAFTAANPTIIIDWATGTIAANLSALAATANTTDGLPEGFVNKYFSNARVKTFLNEVANLQDFRDVVYPSNNPALISLGQTIVWNTSNGGYWAPGNYSPDVSNFANAAEQANVVLSINNFVTANLVEFGNLYFTNERVFANVSNIYIDTLRDVWIQSNALTLGSVLAWDGYGNWIPQTAGSIGNVRSAGTADFATRAGLANVALLANVANVALRAVFAETANSINFVPTLASQVSSLANFTTNNLQEGSNNLYFTTFRVLANVSQMRLDTLFDVNTQVANVGQILTYNGTYWVPGDSNSNALLAAFSERSNIANLVLSLSNFTTDNLQEGSNNLYYNPSRLNNDIQSAIALKDITVNDLVVNGDITVQGNVALFNVSNLRTESRVLTLAASAGSASQAEGSGIYVNGANASLTYSQTNDGFGFSKNLTINGNLIPAISGVYSLGTPTKLWKDLFIGAQTIYLGNTALSELPAGGLAITDQFGNDASIRLGNISATESISVSNIKVINNFGNFTGNSFLGTTDVEITHGGTGANTRPNARRNLFSDFGNGLVARVGGGTNTLVAISIVQGTGVTVTDGDGQNGNPTIAIGQPVAVTDSVQFRNLTVSGNLYVLGNVTSVYSNTLVINDPMIQLGYGNPSDAYDLGFIGHYNTGGLERHAGIFRDHTDGLFKVFDNLTSEPGLNDLDTSNVTFRLANVQATTFLGNVVGTVSSLNNHTTDALREGTGNLYFTTARVNATVRPMLTTANVVESSENLYFTTARVNATVRPMLTTANVIETSGNLYFTNTRVLDALVTSNVRVNNLIVSENFSANNINANTLTVSGNVLFGTGQGGILSGLAYAYATNVIANVLIANTIAPTRITGNLVVDDKIFANGLILRNIDVTDTVISGNITGAGGSIFNTLQANTISTSSLNVTSNIITLLSGVTGGPTTNASISVNRGTNADVALRWEEEIDRWQFTNDGSLYYNLPIPSEYDNVIYSLSAETSNVTYAANIRLTGTKGSGNVLVQDQIAIKGTGLVRVSRQDADTIVVDAGVAPVVVTPVGVAAPVEITRFAASSYRTAEYIYTLNVATYADINHANLYNAGKILMLHDNSSVSFTQYAMLLTGTGEELATFTANINNGNVILYAQAAMAGDQITVRLSGTTYAEV